MRLTDFKLNTPPNLYAASGVGAIKHGDNRLGTVTKIGNLATASVASIGYTIADYELRSFEMYDGYLYGAGTSIVSGNGAMYKFDNNQWQQSGSDAGAAQTGAFVHYQNKFYGYRSAGYIWQQTPASTYNDTWQSISAFTTSAKPVVHFGGKTAYFFTDNKVHQLRDATFTANVIEFQTGFQITYACEYDNYLIIIGYEPKTSHATAAFWDRDSSLARITNVVDLGIGIPNMCAVLNGVPTVVMKNAAADRLTIKRFNQSSFITTHEYTYPTASFFVGSEGYLEDNNFYVPMKGSLRNDDVDDNCYILKIDGEGNVTQVVHNTDDTTNVVTPTAVIKAGGQYHLAFVQLGSLVTSTSLFTQPTIVETRIIAAPDPSDHLQTHAISVYTNPLPSGAVVTFKGRLDEASSWTTLGTSDTDGETRHSITQAAIRGAGVSFGIGRVLQLRVEVTGNTEIKAITGVFDYLNREPYDRATD